MTADWYSEKIYPVISGALSWVSQFVTFSLEEIVVLAFAAVAIIHVVRCIRHKTRFFRMLLKELGLAVTFIAWFYIGWGFNYMRSPLNARVGVPASKYEKDTFAAFLSDYTAGLQASCQGIEEWYRQNGYDISEDLYRQYNLMPSDYIIENTETEVKDFFAKLPSKYGLCRPKSWQHPKRPLINRLYSGVGVLGFMGPFFGESQLNSELTMVDYPSIMAHEYSHLMGVSNEAEANYWAFQACRNSQDPVIRYSAYQSVFVHVWNSANNFLDREELLEWRESVPEIVIMHANADHDYWSSKRIRIIDTVQEYFYNLYLKGNGISSGIKNYSEVISLLISIPEP